MERGARAQARRGDRPAGRRGANPNSNPNPNPNPNHNHNPNPNPTPNPNPGQAHLALNERATVKLAVKEFARALELAPDNKKIKEEYKEAALTWEADYE